MNNYPEIVEVNGRTYNINTSFKVALRCNEISKDSSIDDLERTLGIICTLFGPEAIKYTEDIEILSEKAYKYLTLGEENNNRDKPDMDFIQDYDFIVTSFISDYGIDLDTTDMHWYKFYHLLNGLSNSENGDCCILNRVRNIRNMNLSEIKDSKLRNEMKQVKERFALKSDEPKLTAEQEESMEALNKLIGI